MTQKVHPPLFEGLIRTLDAIFNLNHHADKVIERAFKANRKWGSRDRKMFAEAVYEIVRWRRTLSALHRKFGGSSETAYREWAGIWFAAFQDQYSWESSWTVRAKELREAVPGLSVGERLSYPEWFVEEVRAQLGEPGMEVLDRLNDRPAVFLRANTLKCAPEAVARNLRAEGFPAEQVEAETLVLKERKNVFPSQAFRDGQFEVQDLNSQKVARAVDPRAGEFVIDACAGAGGKTLHLAALMSNRGRILAMDVVEKKLQQLKLRARRAGVSNLEARVIESSKTIKRQEKKADRLLLDVPCSGTGVLRRNPDTKWRLTRERLRELENLQREILDQYSTMVKKGGLLVYATCSILPSENQRQVKDFLSRNEAFELESEATHLPRTDGGDGFYVARLKARI